MLHDMEEYLRHGPSSIALCYHLELETFTHIDTGENFGLPIEALFNGSLASVEVRGTMTSDSGVECME